MPTPNTYKAMIATTLLSTVVVFLAFTLQIKKKSKLISETYYEMEPEPIEEADIEELAEILKSLDDLLNTTNTNQAFNESNNDEFEDKAFEERLEEIRNRNDSENNETETESTNESSSSSSTSDENEANAFDDINDIIAKTSENKRPSNAANGSNKNSSISYSLVNRTKIDIPPPIYLCERGGKVVINITVNSRGTVTNTSFNNSSTTDNGCLVDHALEYAKASKFNADNSRSSQIGTITFIFKGKN
jgi:outer membrane biosynthesis protein TonB